MWVSTFGRSAAAAVAILAAGALAGWLFDIELLKSVISRGNEMKIDTAIALLAAAIAVTQFHTPKPAPRAPILALATIVMVLAGAGLASEVFGLDSASQMPLSTAIALGLLGGSIALQPLGNWSRFWPSGFLATATVATGLFFLLGYHYGARDYLARSTASPMAIHSAVSFILLGAAVLAAHPDRGWFALLFTAESPVATTVRKLMLAAVIAGAALGTLRLLGQRLGFFGVEEGVALMVTAQILTCFALTMWWASSLERANQLQREREAALADSEERYRLVTAASNDATFDWDVVAGRREWNAVIEERFGWPRTDRGRTGTWWHERLHPEDRHRIASGFESAVAASVSSWSGEYRMLRADGRWADIFERTFIMRDESGAPVRVIGALTDITTVKEAERILRNASADLERRVGERTAELAEAYRFTDALVDTAAMIFCVLDRDLRIVRFNKAAERLTGYTQAEVVGRPFYDVLLTPEEREEVVAVANELLEGVYPNTQENWWVTRTGERRRIAWINTAMSGDGGRGQYIIATGLDVTEEREAQAELQRQRDRLADLAQALTAANQELEAFSYSVSHDLRAPLRAIEGFSHSLADDFPQQLAPQAHEDLARIRAAARKMSDLIDGLLTLSHVSRAELRSERVDLSQLATEAATRLRGQYPAVAIDITPSLSARGDARLLRSVVDNLFDNACKFSSGVAAPCVEFGRSAEGTFFVRDNGAGFDPAYADKLFAPFQRLHRERDFTGTGIGLATVRRIIARHGGRIWAASEPGKGATFHFTLEATSR